MYLCATCGLEFCEPISILNDEYPAYYHNGDLLGLEQDYVYCCPYCGSSNITNT